MPAWSGLYDSVHGVPYSTIGIPNPRRRLRRALKGMVALKAKTILRTFVTGDVGSAASKTHTRIHYPSLVNPSLGGLRSIETVTDISRNLDAADQTAFLLEIDGVHTPTFPTEKSGNSGGGKLGF